MKPDLDKVDAGEGDHDVTGDHDARSEQTIEQVDERHRLQRLVRPVVRRPGGQASADHVTSKEAKEYGGQGPPTSIRTSSYWAESCSMASLKRPTWDRSTR